MFVVLMVSTFVPILVCGAIMDARAVTDMLGRPRMGTDLLLGIL